MHYIRFLKPPQLTPRKKANHHTHELFARITITNDLGDLFLSSPLPLEVLLLVHLIQAQKQQHTYHFQWLPYSRALDITFTLSSNFLRDTQGRALPCELIVKRSKTLPGGLLGGKGNESRDEGRIIDLHSELFSLDSEKTTTVKRILCPNQNTTMVIREEKGESISRHIWDAGLILSELFYPIIHENSRFAEELPRVSVALSRKNLKAIELGTGVGLVGLALAESLACGENGSSPEVLLTDLPEARELVELNIASKLRCDGHVSLDFAELDWTKPLPESVAAKDWDVVIIADCTYNPDYAEALANTIKSLLFTRRLRSSEKMALLAMKPRHTAEDVFFEYVAQLGIRIIEQIRIPIPVLGGDSQEIRILALGCDRSFSQSLPV